MNDNIGFLIKKISDRLLAEMNNNLKKYGITARQLEVLSFLNMNGNSSQKDISLTNTGKKQISELDGFRDEVQEIITKELGAENKEHLIKILNKIYDKICEYDKLEKK